MSPDQQQATCPYPFASPDPLNLHPRFAELQTMTPILRVQMPYGEPAWLVTRYEDVKAVFTDPRFSRAMANQRDEPRTFPERKELGMLAMDPPDHTRIRRALNHAFSARRVKATRPKIQRICTSLLDAMTAGDRSADLVAAFSRPLALSSQEAIVAAAQVLAIGQVSASSQITNFVYTLLHHPDQLAKLRADLTLIPSAVEELLRFVPFGATNTVYARYATTEIELAGITVAPGEPVLAASDAANRDPSVFEDPNQLDLTRGENNPHLSFGRGVHHCVAAQLARAQLQIALESLLTRLPNLRIAVAEDAIQWKSGLATLGPVTLPVNW